MFKEWESPKCCAGQHKPVFFLMEVGKGEQNTSVCQNKNS